MERFMDAGEIHRLTGQALALLFRCAPAFLSRLEPDFALILSGEACADLNYLMVGPRAGSAQLRQRVELARLRSLPLLTFLAPPRVEGIEEEVRGLGMSFAGNVPMMARQVCEPLGVLPGWQMHRVAEASMLHAASRIDAAGFDLPNEVCERIYSPALLHVPGVSVFVGSWGDTPMSSLQAVQSGKTVGIFSMATLPQHRRQGAGRALLAQVINHYLRQGVVRFYLGSSDAGLRLYESLGFEALAAWSVWALGETMLNPDARQGAPGKPGRG